MDWLSTHPDVVNSGIALLSAVTAIIYVVFTWKLVVETRKLREFETSPNIAIYLEPERQWISFVDLVIRNIGQGPARDIVFNYTPNITLRKAFSLSDLGVLQGIAYLAPGQELRMFLGSMIEFKEFPDEWPLRLSATYTDSQGKRHEATFVLDIAMFKGLSRVGSAPEYDVAEALKNIAKSLDSVVGNSDFQQRLKVDVITQGEMSREKARLLAAARHGHQVDKSPFQLKAAIRKLRMRIGRWLISGEK